VTGGGEPASGGGDLGALVELDTITRRLRRECPWDREQDERSIVPHTVEEAYELADAACSGDDARLLDELGDVLFQVYFLSLLLEERGSGSLGAVADHCARKLIRRHPHVFGEAQVDDAGEVVRRWDAIKRSEPGGGEGSALGALPANLPALIAARKLQRRAAAAGWEVPEPDDVVRELGERLDRLGPEAARGLSREDRRREGGELLFAAVTLAQALDVDPELALHQAGVRFRAGVEGQG
jgi:MazG family protein